MRANKNRPSPSTGITHRNTSDSRALMENAMPSENSSITGARTATRIIIW